MTDHVAFYEMGMRLQQADLYHRATFSGTPGPGYRSAMHSLWAAYYELPSRLRDATSNQMGEIHCLWTSEDSHPGMERRADGELASYLLPILDEVKRVVTLSAESPDCEVVQAGKWHRLGLAIVDGELRDGQWVWKYRTELDQLLDDVIVELSSLFLEDEDVDVYARQCGVQFPAHYEGWYRLEAGLRRLKKHSFVLSDTQEAILKALDGKAMKKEELAEAVFKNKEQGNRLYRKGGVKELMDRGMVVSDRTRGGYYRPDAPPR